MAGIWPCPSCEKLFLEESALRTHSGQVHGEYLLRGDVEPEEPKAPESQSQPPVVAKYSLRGQASSD